MEKIESFKIDHDKHLPGIYLSRQDRNVYTYDIRFKKPNKGDYVSLRALHTIEHIFATIIRNGEFKDNVVYFGPMGCRTGFYLLLFDIGLDEAKKVILSTFEKCLDIKDIPGNKRKECGNYRCHSLSEAKKEISNFLTNFQKD